MESKVKSDNYKPSHVKLKWTGVGSKVVELPIPFLSKADKTGEVVCDPIGEFPLEDGERLLGLGEAFELISYVYAGPEKGKGTPVGNYYKERSNAAQKIRDSKKQSLVILEDDVKGQYLIWNRKYFHPLLEEEGSF